MMISHNFACKELIVTPMEKEQLNSGSSNHLVLSYPLLAIPILGPFSLKFIPNYADPRYVRVARICLCRLYFWRFENRQALQQRSTIALVILTMISFHADQPQS